MAIVYAIIAVITFANPDISVLDFLPDAIGCLFLYFALATPAEFSNKLDESRTLLFKLILVTAADAVLTFFVSASDGTMILLLSFVFGIAEAGMLYILVDKIFDGMIYLGTRFEATGIYLPAKEKKLERYRSKLERKYARYVERSAKNGKTISPSSVKYTIDTRVAKKTDRSLARLIKLTKTFFILRAVFNILPEFTALSSYGYEGEVHSYDVNIASFRGLFIVFAVFFTTIISIIWLISILRYINGIRRDRPFRRGLREAYETDVIANTGLVHYKRLKLALIILSVAIVLSLDFTIDHINFIPDILSAAAFLLFWLCFMREKKKPILGIALSCIYGIASLAHWLCVVGYIDRFYDFVRTMKSEAAMNTYILCCILSFISEALFVVLMLYTVRKLKEIIHSDTGYVSTGGEHDTYSQKLHARLCKQNNRAFIFSVVTAITSVAYMILVGINKGVEAMENGIKYIVYVPVFESIATVALIISILYIIFTVKHISDISDGLDERYKLT